MNEKPGILIDIEGTDSSGKATQAKLLKEALSKMGLSPTLISFPVYESPSSSLVKMYLAGDFGRNNDVNPYAAATFYAADRYASFKTSWGKTYENGGIIIADRYTSSNAIHQGSKFSGQEQVEYLKWLYDFEHNKIGIPAADIVLYLDVPTDVSQRLLKERNAREGTSPDMMERDVKSLARSRESSLSIANQLGWHVISCAKNGEMRSALSIHRDVLEMALGAIYNKKAV